MAEYSKNAYNGVRYLDPSFWDGGYADSLYWTPGFKPKVEAFIPSLTNDRPSGPAGPSREGDFDINQRETSLINNVERVAPDLANAYGFMEMPTLANAMLGFPGSMIPGGLVKGGMALSNSWSLNEARKALGLPTKGLVSGAFSANKGVVGTVQIGNETYTVTARPDPKDPNQITPNQAVDISAQYGVEITEATPEQVAARESQMKALGTTPSLETSKGAMRSVAKDAVSTVFNEVTGRTPEVQTPVDKAMPTAVAPGTTPQSMPAQQMGLMSPTTPTTTPSQTTPAAPASKPANASIFDQVTGRASPATAAASTASRATTAPSGFLGDLARSQVSNIGMDPAFSANVNTGGILPSRPNAPSDQIMGTVANVVGTVLGPDYSVNVTSGQENAGKQYGSSRHKTGLATDFNITDPTGKMVTNEALLGEVAKGLAAAGVTGIGFGQGYMGGTHIHADVAQPNNPAAWGKGSIGAGMNKALRDQVLSNMALSRGQINTLNSYGSIATPEARPSFLDAPAPMSPSTPQSFMGAMTPAGASAVGMGRQYSPEERNAIGLTLAGELSPQTLEGLTFGDPEAIAEASAVLGVIDNRVNSALGARKGAGLQFGNVQGVLSPDQFNALSTTVGKSGVSPYDTSKNNFAQYKDSIDEFMDSYFGGQVQSPVDNATHYANPDAMSPSAKAANAGWLGQLDEQVGFHSFGTPDASYSTSTGFGSEFGPVGGTIGPDVDTAFSTDEFDDFGAGGLMGYGFSDMSTPDAGLDGLGGVSSPDSTDRASAAAAEQGDKAQGKGEESADTGADAGAEGADSSGSDSGSGGGLSDNNNDNGKGGSSSLF